jgi:hypothetical protein
VIDSRVRLTEDDERKARVMAFDGYPQGEVWRLLRLALHEISCLREDAKADDGR